MKNNTNNGPKLVFSRKGFDSGSGGKYSLFDASTRKYIWFPIPERPNKKRTDAFRYDDIRLRPNYLTGFPQDNLHDLYNNLFPLMKGNIYVDKRNGIKQPIKNVFAHYDPMLGPGPWLDDEQPLTIGRGFGQTRIALGHLRRQDVHENSVFLFFGAFEDRKAKVSGHYIFGWMKVGDYADSFKDAQNYVEEFGLEHHPHMVKGAFDTKNRIYVPAEHLYQDEELTVPGWGYFATLDDSLLLTQDPTANGKMIHWELPEFCYQTIPWGVKSRTWKQHPNGRCTVESTQGQELVTPLKADAEAWLRNLFVQNRDNLYRP